MRLGSALGHPRRRNFPSKSRTSKPYVAFFDSREFIPTGQTVTANFFNDVLDRLIKRINRIRPDLRASGDWFLQLDNAPVQNTTSVRQFLAKKNVTILHHRPYLPDLALADYFLFPKLKLQLKGRRFEDIQTTQNNVTDVLRGILKTNFKHTLEGLAEPS